MATPAVKFSKPQTPRPVTAANCDTIAAVSSPPKVATSNTTQACTGWREPMIRRAAYFRSLQRPPCPGKELEDWLAAEQEIDALIATGAAPYR